MLRGCQQISSCACVCMPGVLCATSTDAVPSLPSRVSPSSDYNQRITECARAMMLHIICRKVCVITVAMCSKFWRRLSYVCVCVSTAKQKPCDYGLVWMYMYVVCFVHGTASQCDCMRRAAEMMKDYDDVVCTRCGELHIRAQGGWFGCAKCGRGLRIPFRVQYIRTKEARELAHRVATDICAFNGRCTKQNTFYIPYVLSHSMVCVMCKKGQTFCRHEWDRRTHFPAFSYVSDDKIQQRMAVGMLGDSVGDGETRKQCKQWDIVGILGLLQLFGARYSQFYFVIRTD